MPIRWSVAPGVVDRVRARVMWAYERQRPEGVSITVDREDVSTGEPIEASLRHAPEHPCHDVEHNAEPTRKTIDRTDLRTGEGGNGALTRPVILESPHGPPISACSAGSSVDACGVDQYVRPCASRW